MKKQTTRELILKYLERHAPASGSEVAEHLGLSRQAVNHHLKALVLAGEVVKQGVTRGATYALKSQIDEAQLHRAVRRSYRLDGLSEDLVLQELAHALSLARRLGRRSLELLRYGFTEMLNNAIDHSNSPKCVVEMQVDPYDCHFVVRDFGIGVFHSIRTKLNLPDEHTALGELLKGKTTTMSERHSGEGIFFTSRAADRLLIRSHRTALAFDNLRRDTVVEETRFLKGTDVRFTIARRSRRDLSAIFEEYSPEEYEHQFQKTRVLVRLFLKEYVSRSEARRMLSGLEKFREIALDFAKVKKIGQGFADEIFRVFRRNHPEIAIRRENVNPTVERMIRHVVDNIIV